LFTADHAVCEVLLRGAGGTRLGFGRKRNVPKSVGSIYFSFDNYFPVFNGRRGTWRREQRSHRHRVRDPWRSSKKWPTCACLERAADKGTVARREDSMWVPVATWTEGPDVVW
jgi:hypothetical protein